MEITTSAHRTCLFVGKNLSSQLSSWVNFRVDVDVPVAADKVRVLGLVEHHRALEGAREHIAIGINLVRGVRVSNGKLRRRTNEVRFRCA